MGRMTQRSELRMLSGYSSCLGGRWWLEESSGGFVGIRAIGSGSRKRDGRKRQRRPADLLRRRVQVILLLGGGKKGSGCGLGFAFRSRGCGKELGELIALHSGSPGRCLWLFAEVGCRLRRGCRPGGECIERLPRHCDNCPVLGDVLCSLLDGIRRAASVQ